MTATDEALEKRIDTLTQWMFDAKQIVIFTGAGISTDSGLPDFRGPDGVWTRKDKGLPPKDEGKDWSKSDPNIAHFAIYDLQELGKLEFLISQNVDNLHLKSGIQFEKLAELHGNIARLRCVRCDTTFEKDDRIASCDCGGSLKSSVVHFGDSLPMQDLQDSFMYSRNCDLFIVIGSSLVVTPAANIPVEAYENRAKLVIINKGETPLDRIAHLRFDEQIGEVFPPAVEKLKKKMVH